MKPIMSTLAVLVAATLAAGTATSQTLYDDAPAEPATVVQTDMLPVDGGSLIVDDLSQPDAVPMDADMLPAEENAMPAADAATPVTDAPTAEAPMPAAAPADMPASADTLSELPTDLPTVTVVYVQAVLADSTPQPLTVEDVKRELREAQLAGAIPFGDAGITADAPHGGQPIPK